MEYPAEGGDEYGAHADAAPAEGGNGWYGGAEGAAGKTAAAEPQGFSIPTTNGGGPMRQPRGGGQRFNPMRSRGGGDNAPVSAAEAERNDQGYIIFAYNIGYQTSETELQDIFMAYGSVAKVNVIQDFATGQGKGFGFVTMPNASEAEAAIGSLNGTDYNGNTLQIRFKSPKGQGGAPSGGRGGRGGGFGGRGGGFRGGPRGGGMRGGPRGGGFRGRGGPRGGGPRGRGRGAYSSAPSAYDGYGYPAAGGYDSYASGYADPAAGGYAGAGYDYSDPYSAYAQPAAGTGYASYGATGTSW